MLTLRYFFRLLKAFLWRFKGLILLSIALGVIFFVFINLLAPRIWGRSIERMGITGRYRTDNLPDFILKMAGDGLTKLNEEGVAEPALADSWETPDKGKTWVFHLRDNIFWQDDKEVTSKTIKYEFSDVEIEIPDERALIFKLQSPFSPLPTVVSKPIFKKGLLGTGEWEATKVTVAGGYVQELILVNEKKDKKIYKFYPTEERTKLAYKLGQVDILLNIFNPSPFDSWRTASVVKEGNNKQVASIFFNTQDGLLSEKSIRQALIYAIDKKGFDGRRAFSSLSPDSWAYNPQVKSYSYDRERAKEFIDDLPDEQKENLSIKLVTTPILLPVAEKIADYWEAIGVETILQVSSGIPDDYQALLAILDIPKDPDQYSIWHSTQTATNISNYQSPRIDKLLEDGRVELELEERRKIYLDFQRFLVEDSPAAFLYHPTAYKVVRK